jgi:beta-alanine degradation protein BauB
MWYRLFRAGVIVCLAATFARAQDPTKADPKHYSLRFENERVQVIAVHYGPHEKSNLHEHPPGVVVNLTSGHLRLTDEYGKTREVYSLPGDTQWFPLVKHTVENLGDQSFNAIYICLKGKPTTVAGDANGDTRLSAEQLGEILADIAQVTPKP